MRLIRLSDNHMYLKSYCELWCQAKCEGDVDTQKKSQEEWFEICEKAWREQSFDSNQEIFLFQKGDEFVGYAEVYLEEKCTPIDDLPSMCARIINFYILPKCRRSKLGSAFFKLIRQWAREKEAAFVEAELHGYNVAAQKFFQSQGMELLGKGVEDRYRIVV